MKTIFIIMDSLNRHYLGAYGNDGIKTPNIDRLAKRGTVFDRHYSCSLPCMPARREMMTGRVNFLEAPWGPIEPWDDCLPKELKMKNNTYTHMITDHYHYFHSGGEAYHTLFDSWEFERGQESDVWRPFAGQPDIPQYKGRNTRPYWVNRKYADTEREEDYPTPRCFMKAMEFLEMNSEQDNWHLHLEVFDPHEPFVCPRKYLDMYDDTWDGRYHFDWPDYAPVKEEQEAVQHIRNRYAGVLTMADSWLGKLLDKMDELDMWKDTNLVFTTDHGHLLGEHGYWAKNYMFVYEELAHIPLIICTPETSYCGRRVSALTSTIDIMPTIMDMHDADILQEVHGRSLLHLLGNGEKHHDAVLYGYFGKDINMYDGRYTYCRQSVEDSFAYHHTAMPRGFNDFIDRSVLSGAETGAFLSQCHGIPHYRIKVKSARHINSPEFNPVYDLWNDPQQQTPLQDKDIERELSEKLRELMLKCDAPRQEFVRTGLQASL